MLKNETIEHVTFKVDEKYLTRKKYHGKLLLLVDIKILPEYELIILVQAHVNVLQVNY